MSSLLFNRAYIEFLSHTHPHLNIRITSLGAPYYTTRINITEVSQSFTARLFSQAAQSFATWLTHPRMTIFGLPFEPYIQTPIIASLPSREEMLTIARAEGAHLVALTNINPTEEENYSLCRRGFVSLPSFPGMSVRLKTNSFNDYLNSLPSKDRQDICRNVRRFNGAGHRVYEATTVSNSAVLHRAYVHARRHSKIKWIAYSPSYFCEWPRSSKNAKLFIAESKALDFLGFVNLIHHEDRVHVARLAVDPAWHRRDAIYFRLLYCALEEACNLRVERVMLGPTAYRLKRHLGAQPQPLNNYFLPVKDSWRFALHALSGLMKRELHYLQSLSSLEQSF